jgi:hypothetical protein
MGSLHVTSGVRIIGAGKRRCRNTTGGYQSLWTPRVALGPRLLLNKQHENGPVSRGARAGFFARRPKRRSFKHRSEIAWPIHTDRRFF